MSLRTLRHQWGDYVRHHGYPPSIWTCDFHGDQIIVTLLERVPCGKWQCVNEEGVSVIVAEEHLIGEIF